MVPPKKTSYDNQETLTFEDLFNQELFIHVCSLLDHNLNEKNLQLSAQKEGTSISDGANLQEDDFMTLAKVAELAQDYRTMQTYVRRAIELRVEDKSGKKDNKGSF